MTGLALWGSSALGSAETVKFIATTVEKHDVFFGSEFFAAMAGALLGGGISYLIQRQSFKEQQAVASRAARVAIAQKNNDVRSRELVLAFSILLKLNRAHTTIKDIRDHLHNGVVNGLRRKMSPAASIIAFSSEPVKIEFNLEELTLVRTLRKAHLLNAILDAPHVCDMYIDNMAVFREIREELARGVSSTFLRPGGLVTTEFKGADAARAKLQMKTADDLILNLFGRSFHDLPFINNLFYDLQEAFMDRFGRSDVGIEWGLSRMQDVPHPNRKYDRHLQP